MGIAPNLSGVPVEVLQQAVLGKVPDIPPYSALAQLNQQVRSQKLRQAMMGQAAMQQNTPMPPVAQQVLSESAGLNSGIGSVPYGYAGGGIVAFAKGGDLTYQEPDTTQDPFLKQLTEAIKAGAAVPEEVKSARSALETAQSAEYNRREAEQQELAKDLAARREAVAARSKQGLMDDPEALLRLAGAFGSARTVGGGLAAAASNAGEFMGQRRRETEQAQAAMRTEAQNLQNVRAANEQLKIAQVQQRLAYATGDAAAIKDANIKVAEASTARDAALKKHAVDKLEAQAKVLGAQAQMTGAQASVQRAESASGAMDYKKMKDAVAALYRNKEWQEATKTIAETTKMPVLANSKFGKERIAAANEAKQRALESVAKQFQVDLRSLLGEVAPAGPGTAPSTAQRNYSWNQLK